MGSPLGHSDDIDEVTGNEQRTGQKPAATKVGQVAAFASSRALFTGLLGGAAALVGTAFLEFQKLGWIAMGFVYAAIGVLYLAGHAGWMMRRIGPALGDMGEVRSSIVPDGHPKLPHLWPGQTPPPEQVAGRGEVTRLSRAWQLAPRPLSCASSCLRSAAGSRDA